MTKRTIQAPRSLDSTDLLLLSRAGNPRLFARPLCAMVPGFRGKGWAEPRMCERGRKTDLRRHRARERHAGRQSGKAETWSLAG